MTTSTTRLTFASRLAQAKGIQETDFESYVLRRCLHAPLRWVFPIFKFAMSEYLQPDMGCARMIGRMRSIREADDELGEFAYHPNNRSFMRRVMKQRLSTHRTHRFLRQLPRSVGSDDSED